MTTITWYIVHLQMFNFHFTRIAKEAVKFKRTLKKTDMKRYSNFMNNK